MNLGFDSYNGFDDEFCPECDELLSDCECGYAEDLIDGLDALERYESDDVDEGLLDMYAVEVEPDDDLDFDIDYDDSDFFMEVEDEDYE